MEKLLIVLSIAISLCLSQASLCFAQEQTIDNQNSYLGVNIEKADPSTDVKQAIKNERSWFLINIIVNGKIQEKAEKCQPEANN